MQPALSGNARLRAGHPARPPLRSLLHPVYAQGQAFTRLWQEVRQGRNSQALLPYQTRDGQPRWLDVCHVALRDADGRVQRILQLASDVTARTREAQSASNVLQAASRSMAIIEFDLHGQVVNANENFLQLMAIAWTPCAASTIAFSAKPRRCRARPTAPSGAGCSAASSSPDCSAGATAGEPPCGCRPPTTRCTTNTANCMGDQVRQ